ncbi:MAG: endonuclease domain-containing protein [Planctomycetes bacterium]|nr:endonuclease domain-containing protein [Planctomycetota bacterium]
MPRRQPLTEEQRSRVRRLRREATVPERILWSHLRRGQLDGLKFRRQFPVGSYFADFYCHESQLAIELDGDSHIGMAKYDQHRTAMIEAKGIRILRISNDDVLRELDLVLEGILLACGRRPDQPPRPSSGG